MKYPEVTIIILNFNGLSDTQKCLGSLLKTEYPNFKIFVADNGSDVDESLILSKKFIDKKIRFVRLPKNLGFSGGNNRIIRSIRSKYVVLLNNDIIVTPNWVRPLVETMEKDAKIAVCQPKILWDKKRDSFDYAGACGGFIDILGYPFTRGRIFHTQEKDNGQYDSEINIVWASGAAMMVRRKILDIVGMFDNRFFNYMEEIDLCMRIINHGHKIVCAPSSYIYHKGAKTASRNPLKKRYWEHRNNLLLILKNYPYLMLLYVYPLRTFLEFTSIIYYVFNRKFNFAFAVIMSQMSLLFIMPEVLIERLLYHKSNRKFKVSFYRGSIVFSYFILNKKVYSNL